MTLEEKLIDSNEFKNLTFVEDGLLGTGGFGKVYKVNSGDNPSRVFALKKINVEHVTRRYLQDSPLQTPMPKNYRNGRKVKKEIWISLFKEAVVMSHLDHKNIVTMHYYYVENQLLYPHDPKYLYLFLEYSPYGTVYKYIKRQKNKRLPEFITKEIVSEVVDGLIYLSDERFIHGDIKSSNILLFPNGQVKICDFGLSFQFDDENKDHYNDTFSNAKEDNKILQKVAANGSPYWLAPEIILHRMATPKSDIWSLGATIVEMLTGKPPFSDYGPLPACHAVGEGAKVEYPKGITNDCTEFLDACFQHNPVKRARAKDLAKYKWIRTSKRNILEHVEEFTERENDYTQDFSSLPPNKSLTFTYGNIQSLSLSELKQVPPAKTNIDFEMLATSYISDFKKHIDNEDVERCEELLRIGEEYLRMYPEALKTLCYQGILPLFYSAYKSNKPNLTTISRIESLMLDCLHEKGREWLLITGFLKLDCNSQPRTKSK